MNLQNIGLLNGTDKSNELQFLVNTMFHLQNIN